MSSRITKMRAFYQPNPRYVGVGLTPDPIVERWVIYVDSVAIGDYSRTHSGKSFYCYVYGDSCGDLKTSHVAESEEEAEAWILAVHAVTTKGDKP